MLWRKPAHRGRARGVLIIAILAASLVVSPDATQAATRLAAPARESSDVPPGIYTIADPAGRRLTLPAPDGPVFLLPPLDQPEQQAWEVRDGEGDTVTIRNPMTGNYLSFDGNPAINKPVLGLGEPRRWILVPAAEPFTFHIVCLGTSHDGPRLALGRSLLPIYPPTTALHPLDPGDPNQSWRLEMR